MFVSITFQYAAKTEISVGVAFQFDSHRQLMYMLFLAKLELIFLKGFDKPWIILNVISVYMKSAFTIFKVKFEIPFDS